jgi:hypothetical protein
MTKFILIILIVGMVLTLPFLLLGGLYLIGLPIVFTWKSYLGSVLIGMFIKLSHSDKVD